MDQHSPKAELVLESGFLDSMGQQVWCVVPHKGDQPIEAILIDIWLTAMNIAQQLAEAKKATEEAYAIADRDRKLLVEENNKLFAKQKRGR